MGSGSTFFSFAGDFGRSLLIILSGSKILLGFPFPLSDFVMGSRMQQHVEQGKPQSMILDNSKFRVDTPRTYILYNTICHVRVEFRNSRQQVINRRRQRPFENYSSWFPRSYVQGCQRRGLMKFVTQWVWLRKYTYLTKTIANDDQMSRIPLLSCQHLLQRSRRLRTVRPNLSEDLSPYYGNVFRSCCKSLPDTEPAINGRAEKDSVQCANMNR